MSYLRDKWDGSQIVCDGITYACHVPSDSIIASEGFVPDSPSPEYPSPIHSAGEVSGIDLTVTGNAGQFYSAHQNIILRSLPDGTHDTWDALTGTVTRNVGVKVFDGTENWLKNSTSNDGNFLFYLAQFAINNNGIYPQSPYCSHATTSLTHPINVAGIYIASTGGLFLNVGNIIGGGTSAYFKAWLAAQYAAGTPVTVYYKLAAPTTEQIDPEALPTYPRYTMLNCNAEVTARVRVIEHGL